MIMAAETDMMLEHDQSTSNICASLCEEIDDFLAVEDKDFPFGTQQTSHFYDEELKYYALHTIGTNDEDKDAKLTNTNKKLISFVFGNNPIKYCSNFYSNANVRCLVLFVIFSKHLCLCVCFL